MFKHKILICFFMIVLITGSLLGCGKVNKNGSKQSDDGRSYGGVIAGEQGQTQHTAFFNLTVDKVEEYSTFQFKDGLYQAESGKTYLLVTLTIKNTYAKDLSMSVTDFVLYCEEEKTNPVYGFGKVDIEQEEMMDNLFSLKKGEEVTKSILYIVPSSENYQLGYTEYYSDEFVGDSFYIQLNPDASTKEQ